VHVAVGALAVAVLRPIRGGERGEIDGRTAELRQIQQRTPRRVVRQVLQDVVTDHEVVGNSRRKVDHRPSSPPIAAAQIRAGLEARVPRPRQRRGEGAAQQADAAPRIEDPAHWDGRVTQRRRNEHGARAHLRRRRDAGFGVQIELAEIRR